MEIRETDFFMRWFEALADKTAKARIQARLNRARAGNLGDIKAVGDGVSEFRIDHGPGYRVYFMQRGRTLIILLAGGDKSTQDRDIRQAKQLAQNLRGAP